MAAVSTPEATETRSGQVTLFAYSAVKDDREVVALYGFANDATGDVTVVAEVWSARSREQVDASRQFHVFPTLERAQHFVNETVVALEFVGCAITELESA